VDPGIRIMPDGSIRRPRGRPFGWRKPKNPLEYQTIHHVVPIIPSV